MLKFIFLLLIGSFNVQSYAGNTTWKCMDENGATVFSIEAIYVSSFKNGLAQVYKNTLVNNQWITGYGFVNIRGEIVISEGHAWLVEQGVKKG
jgi:hypothetical protein